MSTTNVSAGTGIPDKTKPEPSGARRARVAELTYFLCRKWYDDGGRWVAHQPAPDLRITLWLCCGLLMGEPESVELANVIIEHAEFAHHHAVRNKEEETSEFDIFVTNHAVQILTACETKLTEASRRKLERWGRYALKDYAGDRQCDYQFHGANDNMPAKATLGMILGGEYFGDPEAVQHGLWNLRQLRDMLSRRGMVSEYTSPTYSPLTVVNLTEIALLAKSPEARRLAGQCAERVWSDILGHFHPPTGTMGGPYARAYQLDSTGHFSTVACLLWLTLGDATAFDPVEELSREKVRLVHHHDDRATQLGILCWVAFAPASPPDYLLRWLENRKYPFRLKASAERGGAESGEVNTTCYAESDFALGTSDGDAWCELQSEVYFLQYRRKIPMLGVEDLRTVYCRYLIDDQRPGDGLADHLLKPHGLMHTVQEDRMALVLARPSLSLADREVRSLKLSLIIPSHFGRPDQIETDGEWIFLEDGPIHLAVRGLNTTDWGRDEGYAVEDAPNYRMISFFNYRGIPRAFSREELGRTLNGFLSLVGRTSEESRKAFRERVKGTELLDYFHFGCRSVRCRMKETILGISYAVETDRVRYRSINGRLAPRPIWDAEGLPANRLPFLDTVSPNSLDLPYRHLRAVWAPEAPWVIASRGRKSAG